MNSINKSYIEKSLSTYPYRIEICDVVTSTNSVLKETAKNGGENLSVLIASTQTEGRGRLGRTFFSPDGSGLYMSLLLRVSDNENPLLITTGAAVCVARAIEKLTGKKSGIKWVNDIYLDGRKVSGILAESSLGENGFIILGIGVNVLSPENGFPDDIKTRAGSVFSEKGEFLREKVAVEILKELYDKPCRNYVLDEYRSRDILKGKEINVIKNGSSERAVAMSICDDFSLLVKKENGSFENLNTGDVSIKTEV